MEVEWQHRQTDAYAVRKPYRPLARLAYERGVEISLMAMRASIYIVEKSTGLRDENGVELFYAFAARLTRGAAETDFEEDIKLGRVRVRKLIATK